MKTSPFSGSRPTPIQAALFPSITANPFFGFRLHLGQAAGHLAVDHTCGLLKTVKVGPQVVYGAVNTLECLEHPIAPVDYVVGGPYPQLNERVVLDAFGSVRAPRLPGLTLLFVSEKAPSDELRQRAGALGATLLHRPLPE